MEHCERDGRDSAGDVHVERTDLAHLERTERGVHDPGQQADGDDHEECHRESMPVSTTQSASHDNGLPRGEYEEAERVFAALSAGGKVQMPLTETFWSHRFGMFEDRYGKPWMVNCNKPMP